MMDRWKERDKIAKLYFEEVFKPLFPNIKIGSIGEWFSQDSDPISGIFLDFSKITSAFQNSFLEFQGRKQFLHFTNIQSAINILKTGIIRLYDFNHLSDEMEFKYFYHSIEKNLNEYQERIYKKNLFCFSMIEDNYPDVFDNTVDYYWRYYGNDFKGVCMRLEVLEDNLESCIEYLLGKIQYGEDNLKFINELRISNDNFSKRHNVSVQNFKELIHFICSFFKETKFEKENEIRLFSFSKRNNPETVSALDEINNQFKLVSYLEIPINHICPDKWNKEHFKESINTAKYPFPKIIIKEIYLGNSIPTDKFYDCCCLFNIIQQEKKYNIKIKNYDKNKLYLNQ